MKKLITGLILLGLTMSAFAQVRTEKLSEVEVLGVNFAYISKLNVDEPSLPVKTLHEKVAAYDLFNNGTYNPEYDAHYISFFIPEGYILASYNNDGELISTAEKFKDVQLPDHVKDVVMMQYPGWVIESDVYNIKYHFKTGIDRKYRITIANNGKKKVLKIDAEGVFL